VVTLILTAIQLRLDYNAGIAVIHQRFHQIKLTNIDSITQSLWTMDHSSLKIQLDGLTHIPDIIFTKITDENNKLLSSAGKINTNDTISKAIILHKIYRGRDLTLGTLMIVATKKNLYHELINAVIIILISQAIKTFLISFFILFIFYYLVTRHLEKIAQHSAKLELTSRSPRLTLERNDTLITRGDELSHVVESINAMSDKIYSSYNKLLNSQHNLAEREARFSAIFNSITDAIVFADCERHILQTNAGFSRQFGYSKEEVKGKSSIMLYAHPEDYWQQGKERYNAQAIPMSSAYELEYKRKDGSIFLSETTGGAVLLKDGTQIGLIAISRDISAKKRAEEENIRLQHELQQAQKMEAIGLLTGGIAHDFNNILASILGYSRLTLDLLKKSAEPKVIRYIENINSAGERARELVAQLLTFSRKDPGDPEIIKLPTLIDEVISLVRPGIPSSIKLIKIIDDNVPAVLMDITQMHQVLMNLCINARDAMPEHGTLTIELSFETKVNATCHSCKERIEGSYVKLSVEDTGSGIDESILADIFVPFLTTKDVGKGTGMGLSVVHGILHKHHSHIIVETQAGIGTCFHLLIPPVSTQDTTPDTLPEPAILSPDDGNGRHILVVDDEPTLALFLQDLLEIYNYKVTISTSSKDAVELFRQSPDQFDLIITDQTMPEMTGTEMIKQIFQINSDIPVILCSGYNEHVGEKEALKLGCALYLGKPVNNEVLLQAVHTTLKTRQSY